MEGTTMQGRTWEGLVRWKGENGGGRNKEGVGKRDRALLF